MKIEYFLKNDNSWVKTVISYDDFSILVDYLKCHLKEPLGILPGKKSSTHKFGHAIWKSFKKENQMGTLNFKLLVCLL